MAKRAKEYVTPISFYNKIPYNAMKLNSSDIKTPVQYSFLKELNQEVILSTLKKAEQSKGYILRYLNGTDEVKELKLEANMKNAGRTNLNEFKTDEVVIENQQVKLLVKPNEVQTLYFEKN